MSASATIRSPSGFEMVEAILATCLVAATPTLHVSPVRSLTRIRRSRAILPGLPHSRRAPRTSRNASSIDRGSTSGVISSKIAMTWRDISVYREYGGFTTIAFGHRRRAIATGIADFTP